MNRPATGIVAIVDDDRDVLESLQDLLEAAGYVARPFGSCTAFLAADVLGSIDCMITDISMPVMTGLDLELHLRSERPTLPVVLITGLDAAWKQAQSIASAVPARFLFRKPLDSKALLAALQNATARSGDR